MHRLFTHRSIFHIARCAVSKIGGTRQRDILVDVTRRRGKYAMRIFWSGRRNKTVASRAEIRLDKTERRLRFREPNAFAARAIQTQKRLCHGKVVGEIGAGGVFLIVAKAAADDVAMIGNPRCGPLGDRQRFIIAEAIVQLAQRHDRPSVFARINMLIDARDAELAASRVVESVEA